jgi:hypothetical protein
MDSASVLSGYANERFSFFCKTYPIEGLIAAAHKQLIKGSLFDPFSA